MILYLFIFIPVLTATLIYLIPLQAVKKIAIAFQTCLFGVSIYNFFIVRTQGTISLALGGWEAPVGIVLRADTLTSVFLILITFLFLAAFMFGLIEHYADNLFIFMVMILQSLIIAIFLASDLFSLYIAIEVSTLLVSILIMFKKDSRSIYDGLVYLLTNIIGMSFFLLGTGFMYKIFGVLDIWLIKEKMALLQNKNLIFIPFAFLITGVGLKCAVMPVFSWLPKAHATPSSPSIISAILSGLYIKGGLYLFIRFRDMFSPVVNADDYFLVIGIITALGGVIMAIMQKDIKLILAYHTISQIGLILTGLSINNSYAYWGAVLHIFNHAIFKSLLFLTAGIIIKEYGTRNLYRIKGVFNRMPLISVSAVIAILGITGAPFFNGSISKYFITSGASNVLVEIFIYIINLGTLISFIKYASIFPGKKSDEKTEINPIRKAIALIMALLCLLGGVFGVQTVNYIFGINLSVDLLSYIQKVLVYIISLLFGYFIYKRYIKPSDFFRRGFSIELSFNKITAATFLFFVATIAYAWIVI